jgi:hypothetical protein
MTADLGTAHRRRIWRAAVVVTTAAGLLLVSGCQSSARTPAAQAAADTVANSSRPTVTFEPVSSSVDVAPNTPVRIAVKDGTLTAVRVVDAKGRALDGALDASKTQWTGSAPLRIASNYRVTATAADAKGATVEHTAFFSTLKPKATLKARPWASACRSSSASTSRSPTAPLSSEVWS